MKRCCTRTRTLIRIMMGTTIMNILRRMQARCLENTHTRTTTNRWNIAMYISQMSTTAINTEPLRA